VVCFFVTACYEVRMLHSIVTHPGGAHKDELLAVCVLIAETSAPVRRGVPTEEELADPGVAVVDVGGRHEPELANFDHHHFPREHPPTCSLSLLLQARGLYDDAMQFCDWLEVAEWFDSRGPKKTAEWLGVPRKAINQLNSPIDQTLLGRFAKSRELAAGEPLYEFMRMVGEDLLDYLRVIRERIAYTAEHGQRWTVGDLEVVYLPRTDPLPDEPSNAVRAWILANGLERQVAAIVYPDRRGDGYGIARYEDHPRLDFSLVGDADDVHFAHKSGFMLKTTATEPDRLQALIRGATL
jgi:hypothetical protein